MGKAHSTMTQSARLECLEQKFKKLEQRIARVAPDREQERVRARTLVLEHLRKHKTIDGWKFALRHGLVWNDVEEALDEVQKMGSIEDAPDE